MTCWRVLGKYLNICFETKSLKFVAKISENWNMLIKQSKHETETWKFMSPSRVFMNYLRSNLRNLWHETCSYIVSWSQPAATFLVRMRKPFFLFCSSKSKSSLTEHLWQCHTTELTPFSNYHNICLQFRDFPLKILKIYFLHFWARKSVFLKRTVFCQTYIGTISVC